MVTRYCSQLTSAERHVQEQLRNELFNDKANQMVISYVYGEMVGTTLPSHVIA